MDCKLCEYEKNCSLRDLALDITGCEGHSKRKQFSYVSHPNQFVKMCSEKKTNSIHDFSVGDRVIIRGTTIGTGLPRYLEGSPMTVIGFGTINVRCDYDGGKPFMVPPSILEKI